MAYLSGWDNRVELTIDHTKIDSILYDFPILIKVSSDSGITNTNITGVFDELESNDNRKKIAVTTNDGTTQCSVEIERWDHINNEAFLWAKIPEVSDSVDTSLYFYYDSTVSGNMSYIGDTTDLPAQDVWSNNYSFVAHLSTRYDSTTSGTQVSSDGDYVTASIARGVWLDEANSENLSCGTVISGSSYTFETFFKTSDIGKIILKDATTSPMNITLTSGTLDFSVSRPGSDRVNNEGMVHTCYDTLNGNCCDVSDNNAGTFWQSSDSTSNWNKVDLGAENTKNINEVQLQGLSGQAVRMVNSFKIFGSTNDSDWDELYSGNALQNTDLQTFTFSEAVGPYRYYRCNFYSNHGDSLLCMTKIHYIEATIYSVSKTGTYNDNQPHFLTAVRRSNNNDLFLLVDGQTVSGTTDSADYSNVSDPLLLGGYPGNYNSITFDEVRSSEIIRSRSWMEATYYSNMDNLITFESVFLFNGYVKVDGLPAARTVYLYKRSDGELVGNTVSDSGTGYFEIDSHYNGYHYVIILPELTETYNLLSYDKIDPGV